MAQQRAAQGSESEPSYPGAVAPERERSIESCGLKLHVCEWGDPEAPPLVLTHGFYDHARAFDCLAPILAERYRVVAWDARGHGDSDWADAYTWPIDVIDQVNVLRDVGRAHVVGHSRGGGLASDAAGLYPEGVRRLAMLDGFGPAPRGVVVEGTRPFPNRPPGEALAGVLDWRRTASGMPGFRPRSSIEELAASRQLQNPRLSIEWMRYFAFHGARQIEGGWAWKVDPLTGAGFGPFSPSWVDHTLRRLTMPVLALEPGEHDVWALPEPHRTARLENVPQLERVIIEDAGHFMATEQPEAVAAAILSFLGEDE
jgi:pimeloyl-ACP methyl ester carboxylesterase